MSITFPTSPTVGQIFQNWIWSGTSWNAVNPNMTLSTHRVVFTANGTYTPSPGLIFADLETLGGGAGGGSSGGGAASWAFGGGGGGAGGYSKARCTAAQIGSSQTVTIGAAGVGAAGSVTTPGTNGGTTSIGSLCVANGGQGGQSWNAANTMSNGGLGGAVAGAVGDVVAGGAPGGSGTSINRTGTPPAGYGHAGHGGSCPYGGGGLGYSTSGSVNAAGGNGVGYGAGGGGAAVIGATALAGGNGAPGVAIITEYIWASSGAIAAQAVSGARVLIAQQTISTAVATVDFTSGISSTYDRYELVFYGVTLSVADYLGIRCSSDGGNTWPATTADYEFGGTSAFGSTSGAGFTGSNAFTSIQITAANQTANVPIAGIVRAFMLASTTFYKNFLSDTVSYNGSYGAANFRVGGQYLHTTAVNGIRIVPNSGNITAGTFKLYGVVN